MKHIIILGDGMADLPVERLGGKTLLQYAHKPMMDQLAFLLDQKWPIPRFWVMI